MGLCQMLAHKSANRGEKRLESVTQDLEAFCGHAGRTTISTDDVLLLCRRNNDMQEIIKDFVDKEKAEKATAGRAKGTRR